MDEILLRDAVSVGYLRYHADWKGSVQFLLDSNGAGLERYSYDAFGQPTVSDWMGGNVRHWSNQTNWFMFTGREWIMQIGVYDYRNRWYQPQLGRFLQPDPIGFDAGDMNLFRYCGGDPVNKIDPMGLEEISDELNRLGIQASLNSRQSYIVQPGGGSGSRAQLIEENNKTHALRLQPKIVQGYVENVYRTRIGSNIPQLAGQKVIENMKATPGYTERGIGHAHDDLRGAKPGWSGEDMRAARGIDATNKQAAVKGIPVWKALTSDRNNVERLAPTQPGREPSRNSFSTAGIEPSNPLPPTVISAQVASSAPSAADIDADHQATGVPSLGQETVNVPHGKF